MLRLLIVTVFLISTASAVYDSPYHTCQSCVETRYTGFCLLQGSYSGGLCTEVSTCNALRGIFITSCDGMCIECRKSCSALNCSITQWCGVHGACDPGYGLCDCDAMYSGLRCDDLCDCSAGKCDDGVFGSGQCICLDIRT